MNYKSHVARDIVTSCHAIRDMTRRSSNRVYSVERSLEIYHDKQETNLRFAVINHSKLLFANIIMQEKTCLYSC